MRITVRLSGRSSILARVRTLWIAIVRELSARRAYADLDAQSVRWRSGPRGREALVPSMAACQRSMSGTNRLAAHALGLRPFGAAGAGKLSGRTPLAGTKASVPPNERGRAPR